MDESKVLNNKIEDFTEHLPAGQVSKEAEGKLWECEQGFRAFFDNATDGIFLADVENKRFYTGNKKFCQMLGYSFEEIKNLEITEILEKQLRNENTLAKDIPVKRKDGGIFYADVTSAPVMLGEKTYLMGIFNDITERKEIEDKLRKSEEKLKTLEETLQKSREKYRALTDKEITKYKKMEERLKKVYRTAEKERSKMARTLKKRIIDTKKAYRELQESKDELVRTEKLAFTGRIAASIAHEIRNPLTNVSMSVGQLMKAIKPKKSKTKHVEIITRNVERINYLITELLNCARPPKLDIQPFDIHNVLKNVLETAKPKIDLQRIKAVKKFTSKPSIMQVDREQMERVFLNLVINAVEATAKKGRLTIYTERRADSFVIKIQDTGKGIVEEDIIKVFDPFFSSKPEGVGLGLTVCYGIIVSHGGTIEVESKRKRGSVFTVSLPIGQKWGGRNL